MALFYDRVLRHRQIPVNKSDTTWNWSFNTLCRSLKGISVLFEEEQSYIQDTSKFYNPKIRIVSVIIEGKPIQLYEQYDEICKYLAEGMQRDATASEVQRQLKIHSMNAMKYLNNKYSLWFDFRMIDENILHGTIGGQKVPRKESPRKSRNQPNQLKHLKLTYT